MSKNKEGKDWSKRRWIIILSVLASGLALLISIGTFIVNDFWSSLEVHVGKQVRLYVTPDLEPSASAQPLIFLNVSYANKWGKTLAVLNTKLTVRWMVGGESRLEREFESFREVDNIAMAEDSIKQEIITPVVVLGRSTEARKYAFTPMPLVRQEDIPKGTFSLEMNLYCWQSGEWVWQGTYVTENLSSVWQDLQSDTTFQARIANVRRLK